MGIVEPIRQTTVQRKYVGGSSKTFTAG
jgi:hypothetical protein